MDQNEIQSLSFLMVSGKIMHEEMHEMVEKTLRNGESVASDKFLTTKVNEMQRMILSILKVHSRRIAMKVYL